MSPSIYPATAISRCKSHHHEGTNKSQRSIPRLSLHLLLICTYLASIISLTNGQSQGPTLVSDMPYATVAERTLYIQGGFDGHTSYNQLFSLDLTTNWATSSPPWKTLSTLSAPKDEDDGMVISADQKSLIVWGLNTGISTYNIAGDSWSIVSNSQPASIPTSLGKRVATDPRTGIIYKLAGNTFPNITNTQIFAAYNPTTNTSQLLTLPPTVTTTELIYYSLVWSSQRNSTLLYGGYFFQSGLNNTVFYEYRPDTNNWSEITTTGNLPGNRYGHCMVPAYGGTKMIIFGGQYAPNVLSVSIYVLDMATLLWTKGTDIDPSLRRNNMACAVSGDNFIAWGGNQAAQYPSILSTPIVYNLKNNQWVTQYTVSAPSTSSTSVATNTPAPTNPVGPPSKSGGGTAPIIGGVVAGVLVLAIAGFFIRRRSKLAKDGRERSTAAEIEGGRGHGIKLANDSDIPLVSQQAEAASLNKQSPLPEQEFGRYQDQVQPSPYPPSQYQPTPYQPSQYQHPGYQQQSSQYQTSPSQPSPSQLSPSQPSPSQPSPSQPSPSQPSPYQSPKYPPPPNQSNNGHGANPQLVPEHYPSPVAPHPASPPQGTYSKSPQQLPEQHYPSPVAPHPASSPQGTYSKSPQQLPEQHYSAEKALPSPPGSQGPRNPQVRQHQQEEEGNNVYSNSNQLPLEQQVAQIKSQYDQHYQNQQQYLEQIRLEQQQQLEMLQRQIAEGKR